MRLAANIAGHIFCAIYARLTSAKKGFWVFLSSLANLLIYLYLYCYTITLKSPIISVHMTKRHKGRSELPR